MQCFVSSHTNSFVSMGSFLIFDGLTKSLLVCYIFLSFWASKLFTLFIFFSSHLASIFYGTHRCFTIIIRGSSPLSFCKLQSHFWIGSHYLALAGMELTMYFRFATHSKKSACFCLSNDGIKDLYHQTLFFLGFLRNTTSLVLSSVHHIVK